MRALLSSCLVLAVGCGVGAASDSPETVAKAVFEAVRAGDQNAYAGMLRQVADVQSACPMLPAASLNQVTTELGLERDQALRAFASCREAVRFDGAVFDRADRSPADVITYRWSSCTGSLTYTFMRVWFHVGTTQGSMLVNTVAGLPSRWVFEGGISLCESPSP